MRRWEEARAAEAVSGTPGSPEKKERDSDPLAAVLVLGDRAARVGAAIGIFLAVLTHGAGATRAMMSLREMFEAVTEMRAGLHEYLWTMYDVDLTPPEKAKEEKPPEPEKAPEPDPEPIPQPKAVAPAPKEEDPYEPPPAPAQAAKVLTAPEDPSEEKIEDLTDQGFVSGDGTGPGFGMVSAAGTSSAPTWNQAAKPGGVEGGKGTGEVKPPPPPPPPKVDRSRSPGLIGSSDWRNCPFPPEADAEQIDSAVVRIIVTVRADGTPQSVQVASDPGHGFGRAARMCALTKRYTPGLDQDGKPVTKTMPPIAVNFLR
jgi:protein TonB